MAVGIQLAVDRVYNSGGLDSSQTPLLDACRAGKTEKALSLIKNSADLSQRDNNERTALHLAASHGDIKVAKALVAKDNELIHAFDRKGNTPLLSAHICEQHEMVKFFIDSGSEIDHTNLFGKTVLYYACERSNKSIIQKLIAAGATFPDGGGFGNSILLKACEGEKDDSHFVSRLIKGGASVDTKGEKKRSLLHIAAANGKLLIIGALKQKGAELNALDEDGCTALHLSAKKGHFLVSVALKNLGTDLSLREFKYGLTASEYALRNKHTILSGRIADTESVDNSEIA